MRVPHSLIFYLSTLSVCVRADKWVYAHVDLLMYALSKFVSIPSVSSTPAHREDCRQAAIWLAKCLHQLGAHSKTVNPVAAYLLGDVY